RAVARPTAACFSCASGGLIGFELVRQLVDGGFLQIVGIYVHALQQGVIDVVAVARRALSGPDGCTRLGITFQLAYGAAVRIGGFIGRSRWALINSVTYTVVVRIQLGGRTTVGVNTGTGRSVRTLVSGIADTVAVTVQLRCGATDCVNAGARWSVGALVGIVTNTVTIRVRTFSGVVGKAVGIVAHAVAISVRGF